MKRFPVLGHRQFRLLFLGQSASVVGEQVVIVALALLVTDRTHSAVDLGLVLGAQALALVTFLAIGGVWADRLARQRVMLATDLLRAALQLTVAALVLSDTIRVWELVVLEAAFGAAEAFFRPAYSGLIPQTVPENDIQAASALTATSANAAQFAGPAIATALVVGLGAGWAFVFDAITFLVSAALLARMRPRARGLPGPRGSIGQELRSGWREVRSRAWVWVTIAVFTGILFLAYAPWLVLGPALAASRYGATSVFGIVTAVVGVGAIAGALGGLRWRPRRPMRAGLLATLPWPLLNVLFAIGAPLALVLAWAVAAGLGLSLFDVWWETALAQRIPPHALSRVSSFDWMGSLALLPLGYLLAGPLAARVGQVDVLAGGGAIALVLILLGLLSRELRELGQPVD